MHRYCVRQWSGTLDKAAAECALAAAVYFRDAAEAMKIVHAAAKDFIAALCSNYMKEKVINPILARELSHE